MSDELQTSDIISAPQELLDLEKRDPRRAEALWHGLSRDQRLRAVLAADGPARERLITLAKDSRALVRLMAPDEFASTVLEVGPDDAGGLIRFCTDEQLTFLLDLTGWWQEMFAPDRYGAWLPVILSAGADRVKRWLETADLEVLTLLCASWFRVHKYLPNSDDQEPPADLPEFTLDGVYHLEFQDPQIAGVVAQALVVLASELPLRYAELMEAMLWESPAQLSEDANRWRRGRMADLGFPTREEALELWAVPPRGEADWTKLKPKFTLGFPEAVHPRSDRMLGLLPEHLQLPVAAGKLDPDQVEALRFELAYIASAAVTALDADPADPEAVQRAGREGLGLVNIGLELISGQDPVKAAEILARVPLAALARQGAQAVRQINRRAFELIQHGWLAGLPTGLHLLDTPWDRWLAGLVYPRPRCYDPGQGREYRSFLHKADLDQAGDRLAEIEFAGQMLFDLLGIDRLELAALLTGQECVNEPMDIKLSAVVTTWLARRMLGWPGLKPIPRKELGRVVAFLQDRLTDELPRMLMDSCRALDPEREQPARRLLGTLLEIMRTHISRLNPDADLEPAFVGVLVVER